MTAARTIVITGGTKGIGAGIARAFYVTGAHVFLGARHESGLAQSLGPRARFIKTDVCHESDHVRLANAARKETGQLDVYVNCAGFSSWQPLSVVTEKFWNDMIDTNLKGTLWGCKAAAEYLSKDGCIINISSLAGRRGSSNNAVYCASKFGIIGLTQSLAKELGPLGIRVNAVCPVYVETEGLLAALDNPSSPAQGKNVKKYLADFKKQQAALQRLPSGEDVGRTCVFLASADAAAITGQSLNVDCGVLPI